MDKLGIIAAGSVGIVAFIVVAIACHGWLHRRHDRKMGSRKTDRIKL